MLFTDSCSCDSARGRHTHNGHASTRICCSGTTPSTISPQVSEPLAPRNAFSKCSFWIWHRSRPHAGAPPCSQQCSFSLFDILQLTSADPTALAGHLPPVPLSWVELPYFQQFRLAIGHGIEVMHPSSLPFSWDAVPKLELHHAVL